MGAPHVLQQVETFLFADLAGFTALTEAHGDEAAAGLARQFASAVDDQIRSEQTEIVKTVGDGVMVHVAAASEAVDLGREIVGRLAGHRAPPVRVGIHRGTALTLDGDWFGTAVNLASRVADAARPGEVLVTEAVRDAVAPEEQARLEPRGERYFKGVADPVAVYAAARVGAGGHELTIDPVCRMAVDHAIAHSSVRRKGRTYSFCSAKCAGAFRADPRRFVVQSPRARAARGLFQRHLRVFAGVQLLLVGIWAVTAALGATGWPWFLLVALGWGVPLGLHYRAVRHLL